MCWRLREGPEEKKLLLLSEKSEAVENCCGLGKELEGSEEDDSEDGGVGRGDVSSPPMMSSTSGNGEVEAGKGEGFRHGMSNVGGGVAE